MAFSLNQDDADIIKVVFTDDVDFKQRREAVDEVCKLVSNDEPIKLLIDLTDFINKMTLEEQEIFGHYLANAKGLMNAKVASVTSYSQASNVVVEAVAFTQGYQVVNFNNFPDAKAWLQGEFS